MGNDPEIAAVALAAEARRLRGRLDELREGLARIEALPDRWRRFACIVNDGGSLTLLADCAEELEAALEAIPSGHL